MDLYKFNSNSTCALVAKALNADHCALSIEKGTRVWKSGDPGSSEGFATNALCDLGQVT